MLLRASSNSAERSPQRAAAPIQDGGSRSHELIPSAAKTLGALGAVPFIILALASPFLEAPYQERTDFALTAYGAVILSFLGGIHWGLVISDDGPVLNDGAIFARRTISVIPSLVGWGALLLSRPSGQLILAAAFFALLLFDLHAGRKTQTLTWYPKLRLPLTIVVIASLTFAALA